MPTGQGQQESGVRRLTRSMRTETVLLAALSRLLLINRSRKRLIVYCFDALACLLAIVLAFSLRVGALSFPMDPPLLFAAVAIPLFSVTFWLKKIYRSIFRYSGGRTILQLAHAIALYSLPILVIFLFFGIPNIPRTVAIIQPMIFFGLIASGRLMARHILIDMLAARDHGGTARKVLVYGAGSAGQQLALSSRHDPRFNVVGFVDDDARLDGQRLDAIPVFSSSRLPSILGSEDISAVVLALPNIPRSRRAEIVNELREYHVHVQTLPELHELVDGSVSLSDLREVQVEDLLGRDPVQPNEILLARAIVGKTVMVTGAGGSIGSELCRSILRMRPSRLILAEMSELALYQIDAELRETLGEAADQVTIIPELLNLTDRPAVDRLFARNRPQTVFHAAAYKHVPLVEANVISGLRNNVLGTRYAAFAAAETGVDRFILVSTDKAVRPTNVMGASKRVCELVLQALAEGQAHTCFAMVRFGNVLGSSGSVVPRFQKQIRTGGPVTLTDRYVTRYFMTIPEAAQLVIQAGAMANGGEVFLLDMGEPVKIYDLARTMIDLSGLTVRDEDNLAGDIEIVEIGLRSGEKLYEELLIDAHAQSTNHPRISQARESSLPLNKLELLIGAMMDACEEGDTIAAMRVLKQLVPEYNALIHQPSIGAAANPLTSHQFD